MSNDTTTQGVLFKGLLDKPVHARFDQCDSSTDGGALLLKAADVRLGLSEALAAGLHDRRAPEKIIHSMHDLLRQRVYGLACGYEDCNDAARLMGDPIHRLLLERDPVQGDGLASQPTLSRFENGIDVRSLERMGVALAECVIARHRKRLKKRVHRITIDLDPTDDPTYGQQQLTFFNAHYANWCYLPMAGFLQFDEEPDQYLFAYVLRPGDAHASYGAIAILRRIIKRLRGAFRGVRIRVRLDGGFAVPEVLEFLEDQSVEYVIGLAKNEVLKAIAEPLMAQARRASRVSGQTEHVYGESRYEAGSWDDDRRVVFKAEVVRHPGRAPKDNPRFVVTNIRRKPQVIYERIYCQRAPIENRIKELLYGLSIDRTSCTRFLANQCRVLLAATAYVLMQELRLMAARTSLARAQVSTLRERLLKLALWVEQSTRRYVLHLPDSAPWRQDWCRIARQLGAVPI